MLAQVCSRFIKTQDHRLEVLVFLTSDVMKAVAVVLAVCGLSSGIAAPAANRLGLLGLALGGRQGIANAGIGIGSMATNMATGLASQTLGALGGIPVLGPFAQIGQAAVETGNNFAQMGMGISQSVLNGFSGLGNSAGLQLAGRQQLAGQLAAQQQLTARQQLAAQIAAQQQMSQELSQQQAVLQQSAQQQATQQQGTQQNGVAEQETGDIQQTESFQDVLGSPDLDSWWNPSPPQPVYVGS